MNMEDCPHREYIDRGMQMLETRMTNLEKKLDENFKGLFDKISDISTAVTELKTERDIKTRQTPYIITVITVVVNLVLFIVGKFFKL